MKRTIDEAGEGRWFPFEGGWKVMCPYTGQDFNADLFAVQEGGWEHEHCENCRNTINARDTCWVAETRDDFFVICDDCYERLQTKGSLEA